MLLWQGWYFNLKGKMALPSTFVFGIFPSIVHSADIVVVDAVFVKGIGVAFHPPWEQQEGSGCLLVIGSCGCMLHYFERVLNIIHRVADGECSKLYRERFFPGTNHQQQEVCDREVWGWGVAYQLETWWCRLDVTPPPRSSTTTRCSEGLDACS